MLFLCHEKMAKYVTKESKYVMFLRLKTLKLGTFKPFLLPIIFANLLRMKHTSLKNWEQSK